MTRRGLVLLVMVAAVVALALWGIFFRGGPGNRSGSTGALDGGIQPVALAGYLEDGPPGKVVFFGLDGATWNIIDSMIEKGELPTFTKLKNEGAWGYLRSTYCYISAVAWPSMTTGCGPEKTGAYSFAWMDTFEVEPRALNSRDIKVPRIWNIASAAGLKVGIVAMPVTYPPEPVNGIMVTGFMTPGVVPLSLGKPIFARFKRAGKKELARRVGRRSFSIPLKAKKNVFRNKLTIYLLDTVDDQVPKYDTACIIINPVAGKRIVSSAVQKVFCALDSLSPWVKLNYIREQNPDWVWTRMAFKYLNKSGTAELQCYPLYFTLEDTTINLSYPAHLREEMLRDLKRFFPYVGYNKAEIIDFIFDKGKHLDYFYGYDDWQLFMFTFHEPDKIQHEDSFGPYTREMYLRLDKVLGEFINKLPDDVTLFIGSDHGFRPYEYEIGLNAWFDELGLISRNKDLSIDRNKSFVFHYQWNIYVNKKLLEREYQKIPDFTVPPGQPVYEAFLDYLIALAANFKVPGTGEVVPLEFSRLPSPRVEPSPDLVVKGGQGKYKVLLVDSARRRTKIFSKLEPDKTWYHQRDGIFIAYGSNIRKGLQTETKDITDMTPTMLYALGIPPAAYFDGRVMHEIFEEEFTATHPLKVYAYYSDVQKVDYVAGGEDKEKLEDKLRSLGYID